MQAQRQPGKGGLSPAQGCAPLLFSALPLQEGWRKPSPISSLICLLILIPCRFKRHHLTFWAADRRRARRRVRGRSRKRSGKRKRTARTPTDGPSDPPGANPLNILAPLVPVVLLERPVLLRLLHGGGPVAAAAAVGRGPRGRGRGRTGWSMLLRLMRRGGWSRVGIVAGHCGRGRLDGDPKLRSSPRGRGRGLEELRR